LERDEKQVEESKMGDLTWFNHGSIMFNHPEMVVFLG
jgi:hypothetical protein